jgi:signal transduction histidine kinase
VRQIVHDLRNAVHIMGLAAEEIDRKAGDPDRVRAALAPLVRQGEFVASYLEAKLRSLDAAHLDLPSPASLEEAFRDVAESLGGQVAERGRRLQVERCEPATLRIAQVQLGEILERLVEVAVDLADPGGEIALWAAVADGWCTIMLEDEGPGIAFETLAERLRRPEAEGGGAAIEEMIAAAGGQLGIRSRPGDRTSFHVGLPTVEWGAGTLQ